MAERAPSQPVDVTLRTLGAILGTLPVVVLLGACAAKLLPLSEDMRFALAFSLAIPLWIAAMCLAFLVRRGWHAWSACAAACVLLFGVLSLTGCGDDTMPSGDNTDGETDAGAHVAKDAGADASDDGDDAGGVKPSPLYAIMYEVFDDVGSNSYLSLLPSLDIEEIDTDEAREYGGGRAFLQAYNGWVFVGDASTPIVTRYSVSDDGKLVDDKTVSFANFGLEAGNLDAWNATFISPTKAYLFDFEEGTTIIWNPSTMEIIGEIKPPPNFIREGLSLEGSPAVVRGNRLFRTFDWVDYDTVTYEPEKLLAIYDLEKDELIETVKETRCSAFGNLVNTAEDGTIYFSNWIWPVADTLLHGANKSCVLRILPGADRFDPKWSLTYADIADGREGAMFSYLGDDKALISVFHDERISFDEETDPWDYAGSSNWQLWNLDLKTNETSVLDGIDYNAGAFTHMTFPDGRSYVAVPDGTEWIATQLFEIKDGRALPAVKVPGWTYQFARVR